MHGLEDFCFAQEELFLVPAEELSEQGLSPSFARRLLERGLVAEPWLERFERAFRLYWQRAGELASRAPRHWLPPRAQNVCVAREPARARPFYQPLGRASCLVDQAAFEPQSSSLEFATYQFFHLERLALLRQIVPALLHDLSYWLVRTSAEREDFKAGCRRSDERGWRALARALEWIPSCAHAALKPPSPGTDERATELAGTGLLVPARFAAELERLMQRWSVAAEERVNTYFGAHAAYTGTEPEELAAWLRAECPLLLVTGKDGRTLWDPEAPRRTELVQAELAGVTAAAARGLRADWSIVSARSRAFLASLVRPDELPAPGSEIDQNGLAYIHRERGLIACNVHEPGMHRLREATPPFERWMLAARTIHEWGHLAVAAGHVPVPAARRAEFESTQRELERLLGAIVAGAPSALRAHAAAQLAALERRGCTVGRALLGILLERMSDYQSNLLAQRYLTRVESETYVRNNLRPLVGEVESTRLFQTLARHAFEFQYLAFSAVADPRAYFLATTWFGEQYLDRGVLSASRLDELLELVARLCRCHEVDATRYHPQAIPSPAPDPV